jgi:membrane fusion protein (multidrug efflux system)
MFMADAPMLPSIGGMRCQPHLWGVLGLHLIAGCADRKVAPPPAPPPPEVAVMTVEARTIPIEYENVGRTEASKTVEIRARVAGFLLERTFEEGKAVTEGDLLFRIDPRQYEANLEIARARLAQARATERLAQIDADRFREGAATGATTQREIDQAETELASARASVSLATAEVAKAELDLSYTSILSPVTGEIGRAMKDVGTYLDAGDNSLLAVATQTDPMYVTFPVSERDWLTWREDVERGVIRAAYTGPDGKPPDAAHPAPPVRVSLLDGTPYPESGRLTFFAPSVDPRTGTTTARAEFANPAGVLKAGQFVRATIYGWERPGSIVVPQRAVIQNPMGSSVMVVGAEEKVEVRPVTVGPWKGDGWLILDGLRPGERVIVEGIAKAPPGTAVKTAAYAPAP